MQDSISPLLLFSIVLGGVVVCSVGYGYVRHGQRESMLAQIRRRGDALGDAIAGTFLVQPCARCHEFQMRLLEVSPNARSVHYQCMHCDKKMRAAAGSPRSVEATALEASFAQAVRRCNQVFPKEPVRASACFQAPEAPLPYEQTAREPIPEAARTEVWRRDRGRCVKCDSNQNLQFDHIIPVSAGGATSVANLQLLCKQCNLSKAASI